MGFRFREHMKGKLYMLAEPLVERAIEVDLQAHVRDLRALTGAVVGRVTAEGLADHAPLQGKLDLSSLHERRIPYDLAFGEDLRLVGEKDWRWLAPVETFAALPFTIIQGKDAWREIARGELRFDVRRDWRMLLRSVRVSPF